jgi:phi13 family phage major tail protein
MSWEGKEMATIGLDSLYYATITEAPLTGEETYGTPVILAKAISAELSVEIAEETLYADDGAVEVVKEFQSGTISLGVDNIGRSVAAALTGARVDLRGVLVSSGDDVAPAVAVGFRARKPSGHYRYFWLYRVKFGVPSTNLATKGDGITFSTPTIEGTVTRRNRVAENGTRPWKAEVNSDDATVLPATINDWFSAVYEPDFVQT